MAEMTATVAETRANFSKIAATVRETGQPVTVFKNSKPWVLVAPIESGYGDRIPHIDWAAQDVIRVDPETRRTVLPADWDNEEDDGVYDALVRSEAWRNLARLRGVSRSSRHRQGSSGVRD